MSFVIHSTKLKSNINFLNVKQVARHFGHSNSYCNTNFVVKQAVLMGLMPLKLAFLVTTYNRRKTAII